MTIGRRARLNLVVAPVSIVLTVAQLVLVIGSLFAGVVLLATKLWEKVGGYLSGSVAIGIGVVVLTVLIAFCALLGQLPALRKIARKIPAKCKRLIFLGCNDAAKERKRVKRTCNWCRLISPEFRLPLLPHRSQNAVVTKVFESIRLGEKSSGGYDVIVGSSGFGKTKCATMLAETLIRDKDLCFLADSCFFYDFALGPSVQKLFQDRLGGIAHSGALVVVDNFHLALPEIVRELTNLLLDRGRDVVERHFLFLSQPPDAWRLNTKTEIKLFSEARSIGNFHEITSLKRLDIEKAVVSEGARDRIERLRKLITREAPSIAEIQLAQIDQQVEEKSRSFVNRILDYAFSGEYPSMEPDCDGFGSIPQALATGSALAIQRGTFSRVSFRKAFAAVKARNVFLRPFDEWQGRKILRRLSKMGLFPKSSVTGRDHVFHEQLAEQFRDSLGSRDQRFETSFQKALKWRLSSEDDTTRAFRWIAAAELRDVKGLLAQFNSAMTDGNLKTMARRLFANLGDIENAHIRFQLGILLDKSGQFSEARTHLEYASANGDESIVEATQLSLLEAEHGPTRFEMVDQLSHSENKVVRLSAVYWRLHMRGHGGVFQPGELETLCTSLTQTFSRRQFETDHVLANLGYRAYSDACRQVYLRGENVIQRLTSLRESKLAEILRTTNPRILAEEKLYHEAHLLGLIVLPEYAMSGNLIESYEIPSLRATDPSLEELVDQVDLEYNRVQDEFSIFGGREKLYLQADVLNTKIQNPRIDPDSLSNRLAEYEKFIAESGFDDIASYPHIYGFRLAFRRHRNQLLEATDLVLPDLIEEEARDHLNSISHFDHQCGNQYGLWRCRLYEALLDSVSRSPSENKSEELREALSILKKDAVRNGYLGDAKFIQNLLARRSIRIIDVSNAILFHPFVHQ